MPRPRFELADVFRRYGSEFRKKGASVLSLAQRRVMSAIETCRTAALGGHFDVCDRCGFSAISYNSCRNRHCPKCQGQARLVWLEARERDLLPVPYFHVVFTVPQEIADLALFNKRPLYEILFRTASQTLLRIASDPKHLGARIGFLAILHTWGQNLLHHPHLHCVVPAGGLSPGKKTWIASRPRFFLPVRVLSRLFRGLFTSQLQSAFQEGKLRFPGSLAPLAKKNAFDLFLSNLRSRDWVVYSKPPFGGPQQVLRYLGRYTHRVALANDRILAIDDGKVSFRYKDYRHGNKSKAMTLDAPEFIRRFLLHVLPDGFHKIRHYGFLANRARKPSVALCRRLIAETQPVLPVASPAVGPLPALKDPSPRSCPACRLPLRRIHFLPGSTPHPRFCSQTATASARASPAIGAAT